MFQGKSVFFHDFSQKRVLQRDDEERRRDTKRSRDVVLDGVAATASEKLGWQRRWQQIRRRLMDDRQNFNIPGLFITNPPNPPIMATLPPVGAAPMTPAPIVIFSGTRPPFIPPTSPPVFLLPEMPVTNPPITSMSLPPLSFIVPETSAPTTQSPVTSAPITPAPVTPAPITPAPVTPAPVTPAPVTPAPITPAPVTPAPITPAPITPAPITRAPTTSAPITNAPVTSAPITEAPVTAAPTTSAPVSAAPITNAPSSAAPITDAPVTRAPTNAPVSLAPITNAPNTPAPTDPIPTPAPLMPTPFPIFTPAPTLAPLKAPKAPMTPSTKATKAPKQTPPPLQPTPVPLVSNPTPMPNQQDPIFNLTIPTPSPIQNPSLTTPSPAQSSVSTTPSPDQNPLPLTPPLLPTPVSIELLIFTIVLDSVQPTIDATSLSASLSDFLLDSISTMIEGLQEVKLTATIASRRTRRKLQSTSAWSFAGDAIFELNSPVNTTDLMSDLHESQRSVLRQLQSLQQWLDNDNRLTALAVRSVSFPATTNNPPTNTDPDSITSSTAPTSNDNNSLIYIIVGVAGGCIVVVLIFVVWLLVRRRQSARDPKGNKSIDERAEEKQDGPGQEGGNQVDKVLKQLGDTPTTQPPAENDSIDGYSMEGASIGSNTNDTPQKYLPPPPPAHQQLYQQLYGGDEQLYYTNKNGTGAMFSPYSSNETTASSSSVHRDDHSAFSYDQVGKDTQSSHSTVSGSERKQGQQHEQKHDKSRHPEHSDDDDDDSSLFTSEGVEVSDVVAAHPSTSISVDESSNGFVSGSIAWSPATPMFHEESILRLPGDEDVASDVPSDELNLSSINKGVEQDLSGFHKQLAPGAHLSTRKKEIDDGDPFPPFPPLVSKISDDVPDDEKPRKTSLPAQVLPVAKASSAGESFPLSPSFASKLKTKRSKSPAVGSADEMIRTASPAYTTKSLEYPEPTSTGIELKRDANSLSDFLRERRDAKRKSRSRQEW